ncbi:Holliday junction branch migration protein RuvA [Mycoplasmopsis gallinacea]|uniref:Holliday junction branch migration complex subunit RuvA n=1 Tax=Mycoplasmopsis gallinacea TaxID=29556 RepID=A0A449A3J9_9BACT|nr:Holliday junction branch migration protein RuvA [Mycoplasmopsis gallinacea]VEU58826.1 Holliday junction DNA helicase [Mycoplasmopsis gallinacea]
MILYKIGEIVYKNFNNLILENKGEGHIVNVANESRYNVGQKIKLYLYDYRTDYLCNTYGFKDFKERLLFVDLIAIDKVGPKIAMAILDKGWELVASWIAEDKWSDLATINFVSEKVAKNICNELQRKWAKITSNISKKTKEDLNNISEVSKTLETLGFKKKQIEYALENLKTKTNIDQMVEDSIKIIATKGQNELGSKAA